MITRIVKMTFTPEGVPAFQQVFEEAKNKIANFPGCRHLELVQADDPCIFFTLSRWKDADALESYRHSDLFKATWARTKIHFAARAEAWSTTSQFSSEHTS